jgi:hypothetical protein
MSNQDAAIAALFQREFGYGRAIALVGHDPVMTNTDQFNDEYPAHVGNRLNIVKGEVYLPFDWRNECAPTALFDDEDHVVHLDSYGKAERFYRIRRPRCLSEARRFLRLWQRTTGT